MDKIQWKYTKVDDWSEINRKDLQLLGRVWDGTPSEFMAQSLQSNINIIRVNNTKGDEKTDI